MVESTARRERIEPTTASSPSPYYVWQVPDKPVSASLAFPFVDRLEKEVMENFRSLSARGSEVGGILLGRIAAGTPWQISVEDYESVPCEYSRGPLYRLSEVDQAQIERAIQQRAQAGGLAVVGFFRSHTRKGIALDPDDVMFLEKRFREPHQIAMLVRPFATKASVAGIFIWENGVMNAEASYLEFPFRSSQLTGGTLPFEVVTAPPPAPAPPKPAARGQIVPIATRREVPAPTPVAAAPAVTEKAPEVKAPEAPRVETPAPAAKAAPAPEQKPAPPKPAESKAAEPKPVVKPAEPKPAVKAAEPKAAVKAAEPKPVVKAAEPKVAEAPAAVKAAEPKAAPQKAAEPKAAEAKVAEPKRAEKPAAAQTGLSRNLVLGVGGVAAAVLLLVALFVYPGYLSHSRTAPSVPPGSNELTLRVEHSGTDLLLTWNRDAEAITNATAAVLSISDGERQENYPLDLRQLKEGSIIYSPLTADVSFRIELTERDQSKRTTESVRMLRTRPSPIADTPGAASSQKAANTPAPAAAPANSNTAAANTTTTAASQTPAPAPAASPKKFDTASLAQRLRPAKEADLADAAPLDAPAAPGINMANNAPAPFSSAALNVPRPVAPAPPPVAAPPAAATTTTSAPATAKPAPNPGGTQIRQAQLVYRKEPQYPPLARQMGAKGEVELLATIGADGKVKSVKILKGHPLLARAASDAVMQWVYRPTLLNGSPVQNDTKITLSFQ